MRKSALPIKYPWHRPGGTTPCVLWVCLTCGEAFWAAELSGRQHSCLNGSCKVYGKPRSTRRGTTAESLEAEKHLKVDSKVLEAEHLKTLLKGK